MTHWTIERIRAAFRADDYRLTLHAESEREADAISIDELESAFGFETLELIEEYPSDPRVTAHCSWASAGQAIPCTESSA